MCYESIGDCFYDNLKYEDSRDSYKKALEIYEAIFEPNHPRVLSTRKDMHDAERLIEGLVVSPKKEIKQDDEKCIMF